MELTLEKLTSLSAKIKEVGDVVYAQDEDDNLFYLGKISKVTKNNYLVEFGDGHSVRYPVDSTDLKSLPKGTRVLKKGQTRAQLAEIKRKAKEILDAKKAAKAEKENQISRLGPLSDAIKEAGRVRRGSGDWEKDKKVAKESKQEALKRNEETNRIIADVVKWAGEESLKKTEELIYKDRTKTANKWAKLLKMPAGSKVDVHAGNISKISWYKSGGYAGENTIKKMRQHLKSIGFKPYNQFNNASPDGSHTAQNECFVNDQGISVSMTSYYGTVAYQNSFSIWVSIPNNPLPNKSVERLGLKTEPKEKKRKE